MTEPGVTITLREVYDQGRETARKLDQVIGAVEQMVALNERLGQHGERLRKAESQIAAQWIVVGIVVTVIGAAVVRFVTG